MIKSRTIVIPCDESENTKKTLEFYKSKIEQPGDLLVLIHVRPLAYNAFDLEIDSVYVPSSSELEELDGLEQNRSIDLLKKVSSEFDNIKTISLVGDPRQQLTMKIEELKPDFVVIGKRGLGTLSRLLLGSVSDHLLHHLHYPVMVVP
jgi:nucleotide-binding universal stress UspA family protein